MRPVLFLLVLLLAVPTRGEDMPAEAPKAFPKNDCDFKVRTAECFISGAEFMDQYCRVTYLSASLPAQTGDSMSCAAGAEAYLEPMYKEMLRRYRGRTAGSAIKDFYAARLAGLRGIRPLGEESRITYQARQASTRQAIQEKRARMELELR